MTVLPVILRIGCTGFQKGGKEMNKYYRCEHCGNVFEILENSGVNPKCCGDDMIPMTQLEFEKFCNSCSLGA